MTEKNQNEFERIVNDEVGDLNKYKIAFEIEYIPPIIKPQFIDKNYEIEMSIIQVSDTGYFDNDTQGSRRELETFASEVESESKLIFVIEKTIQKKKSAWDEEWIRKEVYNNHKRMSAKHTKDCLYDKGNIQIIYSFPLIRFLDEDSTIETLKEFILYCNVNGILELRLV